VQFISKYIVSVGPESEKDLGVGHQVPSYITTRYVVLCLLCLRRRGSDLDNEKNSSRAKNPTQIFILLSNVCVESLKISYFNKFYEKAVL